MNNTYNILVDGTYTALDRDNFLYIALFKHFDLELKNFKSVANNNTSEYLGLTEALKHLKIFIEKKECYGKVSKLVHPDKLEDNRHGFVKKAFILMSQKLAPVANQLLEQNQKIKALAEDLQKLVNNINGNDLMRPSYKSYLAVTLAMYKMETNQFNALYAKVIANQAQDPLPNGQSRPSYANQSARPSYHNHNDNYNARQTNSNSAAKAHDKARSFFANKGI